LLTRQALEGVVTAEVLAAHGALEAPFTVQLLCYQRLHDDGRGERAAAVWSGLSRACHAVGYELPPTVGALRAWVAATERWVG